MPKPTPEQLKKMSLEEYRAYAVEYCNACASCGQVGEKVVESIEGKGFYYCEGGCKKAP